MRTVTIDLTNSNSLKALQDLEHKHLIRIVKEPDLNSYFCLYFYIIHFRDCVTSRQGRARNESFLKNDH